MIRMMRNIAIAAIALCLIFGLQGISHSDRLTEGQRLYLQKHVEKVRIEKPREYQEMMDKAGTIVNCLSCHEDEFKKEEDSR